MESMKLSDLITKENYINATKIIAGMRCDYVALQIAANDKLASNAGIDIKNPITKVCYRMCSFKHFESYCILDSISDIYMEWIKTIAELSKFTFSELEALTGAATKITSKITGQSSTNRGAEYMDIILSGVTRDDAPKLKALLVDTTLKIFMLYREFDQIHPNNTMNTGESNRAVSNVNKHIDDIMEVLKKSTTDFPITGYYDDNGRLKTSKRYEDISMDLNGYMRVIDFLDDAKIPYTITA